MEEYTGQDQPISAGNVVIVFYANWCGPCKAFKPVIEEAVGEREDITAAYRVNIEKKAETAASFDVRSIPTVVLVRDGEEANRLVGSKNLDDTRALFEPLDA